MTPQGYREPKFRWGSRRAVYRQDSVYPRRGEPANGCACRPCLHFRIAHCPMPNAPPPACPVSSAAARLNPLHCLECLPQRRRRGEARPGAGSSESLLCTSRLEPAGSDGLPVPAGSCLSVVDHGHAQVSNDRGNLEKMGRPRARVEGGGDAQPWLSVAQRGVAGQSSAAEPTPKGTPVPDRVMRPVPQASASSVALNGQVMLPACMASLPRTTAAGDQPAGWMGGRTERGSTQNSSAQLRCGHRTDQAARDLCLCLPARNQNRRGAGQK